MTLHSAKQIDKIIGSLLFLLCFQLTGICQIQYPYLRTELKTNCNKITCLDDFNVEAKQINWQLLDPDERDFTFLNLKYISPEKANALVWSFNAAGEKKFIQTTDGGKSWGYNKIIKYSYIYHMQMFGKDTIVLYGKRILNYNTYDYQRYRYFSHNGGQSWDSIKTNLPTDQSLTFFISPKIAYCVVQNSFYSSTDGGIYWEKQSEVSIGFKMDLYSPKINDVFLLNDNALYRSIDGGKKWLKIPLPYENGFTDLCMKGNIGYISSQMGRILKTEDGGETWEIANNKLFPRLSKIEMKGTDSVFVAGDRGTILFSADAGITWQEQYTDNREDLYEIQILDSENIYAAGILSIFKYHKTEVISDYQWEPKNLLISSQGNKITANATNDTWFRAMAKNSSGKTFSDSILIKISTPSIVISSDSTKDVTSRIRLHALTDAGTWSLSSEVRDNYLDIEVISQDTFIIGGQNEEYGVILKSTDAGKNWFHVKQKIDLRIDDIEFVNSKVGYAGGYLGYLIKSVDGGEHWDKLKSPTNEDVKSISFVSPDTGYIAADRGQVYKTTDGGKTWKYHYLPYDFAFRIKFLDEQNGFLIHNYSGFLSTTDGGESWQSVPHDKFFDLMDITFVNKKVGYVSGGMLGPFLYLKTNDGGKTWMEKIFPRWTLTTYHTLRFTDENSGFVFNKIGEIIITGDGGQNWFVLDTLKYNDPYTHESYPFTINSFRFIDSNFAIGVGGGQIVRYEFSPRIKYKWLPDSKVSGGTTAHPLVPTYAAKTYNGYIFRDENCGVYDRIEIPLINASAKITDRPDLTIYPQPACDELFISSSQLSDFDFIKIFDINGVVQFSKEIKENNGLVKMKPELTPGIYVIEISGKEESTRRKIIFQ